MNTPFKIVKLDELNLSQFAPVFFDTETLGFYGKVRLAQFFQAGDEYVQVVEWPDELRLGLLMNNYHNVMHNAHYDITTIQQQTETRWTPKSVYDDTFLLARLSFPQKEKFSLDDVMGYVLGYDPYKAQKLDKKKLQKSDWSKAILSHDQFAYAATDVYYMPQVWDAVKHYLEDQSYKLDMLTMKYCLDFQWNGMPIDHDRIETHFIENNARIAEINLPINCNSWQQVRPYIESENSDALGLATLTHFGSQKAKDVNETRKLIKQNSFLKKYDNMYELIGKFLPSARSGRLTSKDENKQQIPRKLKDCFGGTMMVYADYAQLELRTIAAITNCELMVQKFKEGIDVHSFTAEMIFGKDFTKDHRQLTKTANFNFLYGGGVSVFCSILLLQAATWMEEREGYSLRKKWRTLWREIYTWQQKGISAWKKGKIWSTPMGRKYKGKMMTDQLNIQNQGAGAEVAKLALHYMYPKVSCIPGVKLVNFIHDSWIFTIEDNDIEKGKKVAKILADAMQEAWVEMSTLFAVTDLPMPVNVRIGMNWGDIENDDFMWELNQ